MRRFSTIKGFSLIEVSLALLVIAIGFLGILALVPGALKIQQRTAVSVDARLICEDLLNDIRMNPDVLLEPEHPANGESNEIFYYYNLEGKRVGLEGATLRARVERRPVQEAQLQGTIWVDIVLNEVRDEEEIFRLSALVRSEEPEEPEE